MNLLLKFIVIYGDQPQFYLVKDLSTMLCLSMNVQILHGFFLLKHKSEFSQCFIDYHKHVQTQFNQKIKIFQTDGGGEFNNKILLSYFVDHGIHHQMSCPAYTGTKRNG